MFTQRLVFGCQRSMHGRAPGGAGADHVRLGAAPVSERPCGAKIYRGRHGLRRSRPSLESGGDSGARTRSLRLAKPALSQLSYIPRSATSDGTWRCQVLPRASTLVGLGGLEPPTSRLSGVRSNQLSYRPTPQQRLPKRLSVRCTGHPVPPPSRSALEGPEPGQPLRDESSPAGDAGQAHPSPGFQKERE